MKNKTKIQDFLKNEGVLNRCSIKLLEINASSIVAFIFFWFKHPIWILLRQNLGELQTILKL